MNQYVVVKGDTLWKIARANNISLDALLAANSQITDPNYIMPGQVLNIPDAAADATNGMGSATGICPPGNPFYGFNLPLSDNKTNAWGRMNHKPMRNGNPGMMDGGMNRNMPADSSGPLPNLDRNTVMACDANASVRPCVYTTVAAGETLDQIAAKFMVPISHMLYYNPCFGRQAPLVAGARVIIPANETVQQQRLPQQYQRYNRRR